MVGQQIQLTATTNGLTGPVTWSSGNTAVATVNSTGLVMALTLGQATITASSDGQSGAAALTTTTGLTFDVLSAGGSHTCGVLSYNPDVSTGGPMYCWGDNTFGQLGNGTTTNSTTPVAVLGVASVWQQVSAGSTHTCSNFSNGALQDASAGVVCWGDNSAGQLGNGTTTNSTTPVATLLSNRDQNVVTAGTLYSCAYEGCWGSNTYGQLGNGTTTSSALPVEVASEPLSAGADHVCGVIQSGPDLYDAYCWGANTSGQLGNGTTTDSTIPVPVSGALNPFTISAGGHHTCGLAGPGFAFTGPVYCWGDNSFGQLGNGTTTNSTTPVPISGASPYLFATVSAGASHTCGVAPNGIGYCWGDNSFGQLGNGTMTNSTTPVLVSGGLSFAWISAGGRHTCGMIGLPYTGPTPGGPSLGGAVYCWGDNSSGQLGNSWTTSSSVPVNVAGGQ